VGLCLEYPNWRSPNRSKEAGSSALGSAKFVENGGFKRLIQATARWLVEFSIALQLQTKD